MAQLSNTQKLKLISLLTAVGWGLFALAALLRGDTAEAVKDLVAAGTTAGLPSVWLHGWVVTVPAPDPEPTKPAARKAA